MPPKTSSKPVVLLSGHTATLEWAALLLRKAGLVTLFAERRKRNGVTVSDPWAGTKGRSYRSLRQALKALDTDVLLLDADDRERGIEPASVQDGDLPCPTVVVSSFGAYEGAPQGSDITVSAASGAMYLTGASKDPTGRPYTLCDHHTDTIAGSMTGIAVLAALMGGRPGQITELTKHEVMAYCATHEAMKWTHSSLIASRQGKPAYQPNEVMRAADGDIFAMCVEESQWVRFVEAMGNPEWASWPIFGSRPLRASAWDILEPLLAEWIGPRTRREIMDIALEHRVPFADCLRPDEVSELQEELSGTSHVPDWLSRITSPVADAPKQKWRPKRGKRPLEGTTVLDLSSVWAAPFSARLLGHLGARVVKVETHARFDHSRFRIGEFDEVREDWEEYDRKGTFNETNQGKESVLLNLTTPEGQELCRQLATRADVLVSNHPPGLLDRMGLGTQQLWELNPGLVVARLIAYHPQSRLAKMPAYGYGLLLQCGFGYKGPGKPWVDRSLAYPDPQAGAIVAMGMINGLRERMRTGHGCEVEVDLFGASAAIHALFDPSARRLAPVLDIPTEAMNLTVPVRGEEWITITCRTAEDVTRLSGLFSIDAPPTSGEGGIEVFEGRLAGALAKWDAQELQAFLQAQGLIAQRVIDSRQLFRESGLIERGFYRMPQDDRHLHTASPWVVDGERLGMPRRAPRLGEHTAVVLKEFLGIEGEALHELEERQIAW